MSFTITSGPFIPSFVHLVVVLVIFSARFRFVYMLLGGRNLLKYYYCTRSTPYICGKTKYETLPKPIIILLCRSGRMRVDRHNEVRTCALVRRHVFERPMVNLVDVHSSGRSFWTSSKLNICFSLRVVDNSIKRSLDFYGLWRSF